MDQIARLREAADIQTAAGRPGLAVELRAMADELDRRAHEDERVAGVLVEAARRRGRGSPGRGAKPADTFMPGALPLAVRKKVPGDVAAIYDGAGAKVVHNALAKLRGTFAEELDRAKEEIKAAITKQFGADGLTRYLPFMGEWADSILANLFEHGHGEMTRAHESGNPLMAMSRDALAGALGAQEATRVIVAPLPPSQPVQAAPAVPGALPVAPQMLGIVPPGPTTADGTLTPPATTTTSGR